MTEGTDNVSNAMRQLNVTPPARPTTRPPNTEPNSMATPTKRNGPSTGPPNIKAERKRKARERMGGNHQNKTSRMYNNMEKNMTEVRNPPKA